MRISERTLYGLAQVFKLLAEYTPGTFSKIDELVELSKVVASHDGYYASHMRDEVRASVEQRLADMVQLESEDVAAAILYAVTQPPHVNVNILTLYPTQQA